MTGRDVVSASLRLIGATAPGESISAQEAVDGLAAMNRMLSSWSTEGCALYAITQESAITLVAGRPTYTLGSGGDITTRPLDIVAAFIRDGSTDYPIKMISETEYAKITNKSVQSTYPDRMYDDGGYPLRTLTLFPTPSAGKSLMLMTRRPLTQVTTIDTVLSVPEGYERAIIHNLAIDLAAEYGKPIPDSVALIASESKANLKRANHRPSYLRADSALVGRKRFNMITGDQ